jgi:hypothetical protein
MWLLLGAAFFGLVTISSTTPVRDHVTLRLAQAATSALLVGSYLALEFFHGMLLLQLVVLGSTLVVAAFMVVLRVGDVLS